MCKSPLRETTPEKLIEPELCMVNSSFIITGVSNIAEFVGSDDFLI